MSIDLSKIAPLGIDPIPGDSPAGENLSGNDNYDLLDRQFRELTSLEGGAGGQDVRPVSDSDQATWAGVAELSIGLLSERSKTIRVAAFLVIALFYEEGLIGLTAGVKLLDGLLNNFWETMYPPLKLLKGRASALEFVATNISGASSSPGGQLEIKSEKILKEWRAVLADNPSASAFEAAYEELKLNHESMSEAKTVINSIKTLVYEKFPQDKLPVITSLVETIKNIERNLGEEVKANKPPEPTPGQEPGAPSAGQAPAQGAVARTPSAPAGAISSGSPEEARKALLQLAPVLREADPTDPASYRLARIGAWGNLANLPPTTEGNATRVPPGQVNAKMIEAATNLLSTSNWMMLLNQSEPRFVSCPLWLDQQYHIFKALKGMGPAFEPAAEAVCGELANLLRRLPGLQTLEFNGGIPFADMATRQWIETEVMSGSAAGGGGGAPAGPMPALSDGSSELDEAIVKARELAGQGQLNEALRLLQGGPSSSTSIRERFLWRMAMARLAGEAGKGKLMQPTWEGLLQDVDRFQLENWEPGLCVPVLQSLYQICKADKKQTERASELFSRLSRVDIAAAMSLEKS